MVIPPDTLVHPQLTCTFSFMAVFIINARIMKDLNVQNRTKDHDTLRYYPDGAVKIDLDNILIIDKMVYPNNLYLKVEGVHMNPIRVLRIWDENGFIHMRVQQTEGKKRIYDISHILDPDIQYFSWWITDYDYFMKSLEDRVMMELIVG